MRQPHCSSASLRDSLESHLHQLHQDLQQADLATAARQSGFWQRRPRKIPLLALAYALVSLAAETVLSLERVASVISLAAGVPYSKQALRKRLGLKLELFLGQVATLWFGQLSRPVAGWFKTFKRVLLHDSTTQTLPGKLAQVFPGTANARKHYAAVKLQFLCDLLHGQVLQVSLSSFRRNDQAAAGDILSVIQPGDLVLRDLGYFALAVLDRIRLALAFFLTRCSHGVGIYDPATGQQIDLRRRLQLGQSLDIDVLVGHQKMPARLVAVPLPEAVANERRRKARSSRHASPPSAKKLYLLSWNIFLTNVAREVWPVRALSPLYRLRWRIEIIFKAWKSHLGFTELNCRTPDMVRLSVMTKLLFCIAVYRLCDALELLGDAHHHVSLLRLARILGQCAAWFAVTFLGVSWRRWMEWHLGRHLFYEERNDRKSFYELLAEASTAQVYAYALKQRPVLASSLRM